MLHVITGANGAGKTLNTLKWVMERAKKENRPVCHNGRFKPKPGGPLDGWKHIDFKDWQAEPDGTIFLIDEAHNDIPTRGSGAAVPEPVRMLAEHRRRGFDFYFITQHPSQLDKFVRGLVGSPGWHRHIKRIFGQDLVSVLEWDAVNLNCEKPNSSASSGTSSQQLFPKEVYNWYESATIHTNKKKIPKMVWILGLSVIVAITMTIISVRSVSKMAEASDKPAPKTAPAAAPAAAVKQAGGGGVGGVQRIDAAEYLRLRQARLADFPHTAPLYDDITRPTVAPYPAACVTNGDKCKCYTQQATPMRVSAEICKQIVENGYFVDWMPERSEHRRAVADPEKNHQQQRHADYRPGGAYVPAPVNDPIFVGSDYEERLSQRNAGVTSMFGR